MMSFFYLLERERVIDSLFVEFLKKEKTQRTSHMIELLKSQDLLA